MPEQREHDGDGPGGTRRSRPRATNNWLTRWWLGLPLRGKGVVVLALPLAALMFATVTFATVTAQSKSMAAALTRTSQLRTRVNAALALAIDAETGVRGYILTGQASFLQPYRLARAELLAELDGVAAVLGSDPAEVRALGALHADVVADLDVLAELAAMPSPVTSNPPRLAALLDQGKTLTDRVRTEITALQSAARQTFDAQRASLDAMERLALIAVLVAAAVGLVGGVLGAWLFTSGIVRRIRAIGANAQHLASGEPLEQVATSGDEVGELARGLAGASDLLMDRERALESERSFFEHLVSASSVVKFTGPSPSPGSGYDSPNVEHFIGAPSTSLVGEGAWLRCIHAEDRPRFEREVEAAVGSGARRLNQEYRVVDRTGATRWVESVARLDFDERGALTSVLGSLVDVTERREAEEELRERESTLNAIFAATPDPILIVGPDQVVHTASDAAASLLGTSPAGRPLAAIIHAADWPDTATALAAFAAHGGSAIRFRARLAAANDRLVVADFHGQALTATNGSSPDVVLALRDFTEQQRLEDGLRRVTAEADSANRAKSDFLSRMSHELRTPLNAVLGFAQLLGLEELEESQRESLEHIVRGGRHLLDLVNEVLDIARIEAGRLTLSLEPVHVYDVAREVLELLAPIAAEHSVHLVGERLGSCAENVVADRQRLMQILLNLVSNAIKYNRPGGRVELWCARSDEDELRVGVTDTGYGLSPDQLELAFVPFERLGADLTEIEGTGVGLALSRGLAAAMGGRLDAASRPGAGSTFTVVLPLAEGQVERMERLGPTPGRAGIPAPPAARERRLVLHIEDNLSNQRLVERILEQRPGIELIVAAHGRLGFELARAQRPDLILLDVHLPDESGDRILARLREDAITTRIPVVMVSADATPGQIERLLAAGAHSYLTKPLDVLELLRVVDTLTTRRAEDEQETL